jgi:iduronate 2-sulfatase
MKAYYIVSLISLSVLFSGCGPDKGSVYKLYYLGGQSNMDGYGYVSELSDELSESVSKILIFHGNTSADDTVADGKGIWAPLRAGHGAGFSSDGISNTYSERFGVEITFGKKIIELNPDSKIAFLKYSRGGTSIDEEAAGNYGTWDPQYKDGEGINQYDHFLAAVKNSFSIKDIDGDGKEDRLIPSGIIWMQGESDATGDEEVVNRYFDNLSELMYLIRDALGDNEIPVIIGRISDSGNDPSGKVWEYGAAIRKAQHEFVSADQNAAIVVTTDNYNYSDPWHYDSEGYIDLGNNFALALDSLVRR